MASSDDFDRRQHRFPESRFFEDLAVGERFYIPSRTVTEANFAAFQTVSADNHPIHYDVEYCRERGIPARWRTASRCCASPPPGPEPLPTSSATR
jgi:acyl dehydratase